MRELTGPKVFGIALAGFGLIFAVNFYMAFKAVSSFPGLEVADPYIASQTFNADRAAQMALGWVVTPLYDPASRQIHLRVVGADGAPVTLGDLTVLVGRATEAADDIRPVFVQTGADYAAPADLAMGKWMMQVAAHAQDGTPFHQRLQLWVKG